MAKVTKQVVVNTPLERFYDLVVDYERYPEFVPGIHGCRILKDGPEKHVEYQLDLGVKRIKYVLRMEERRPTHVAWSLVESNLAGHDSHGVIRILTYVTFIDNGWVIPAARPEILNETETTATVKGNWSFGQISATYATDLAIAKAKKHHLAAVGIVEGTHIGRLGEYAERITRENLVAMIAVGGFPRGIAAPYGGMGRALSNRFFQYGA
jgi:LDH2 family malate/lactate/ureidoglycolate dehydrogenase